MRKYFYILDHSPSFYEVFTSRWVVCTFLGFKWIRHLGMDVTAFDNREEAMLHLRISRAAYVRYKQTHR